MDTVKLHQQKTKIIAHRGLSGIEPQNTNIAFVAAGNRSYYGIETDVHKTKDGKYVIIHDDNTANVSFCNLAVEETDYEILRNIHLLDSDGLLGRLDLRIPRLEDYIKICKKYEKTAVLELKNAFSAENIAEIVQIIRELGHLEQTIFISFHYQNLLFLRELLPEHPLQFLTGEVDDKLITCLKADRIELDIYYPRLNKELVEKLHQNGILVNCWTCDSKEDAQKLLDWGVDFITTDILE